MSHHFIVPTNENGVSLDPDIGTDISLALGGPFGFGDVFIYSHGWWTDAVRAMQGYNRFTIEFSAQFRSAAALSGLPTLNIGIHWPSTLTEDQFSLLNYAEALSFYTMEKRADTVGENCVYALLKIILNARRAAPGPLRIHLIGHSFGCKAVCKALQKVVDGSGGEPVPAGATFDVALLEAAFDDNELETGKDYGGIASLPGLRLLVTRSTGDRALSTLYPAAHKLAHLFRNNRLALGSVGPTPVVVAQYGGVQTVAVGPGFVPGPAVPAGSRLVLADLSALHSANPQNNDPHSGHHSDMFYTEIYRLLGWFFF